MKSKLYLTACAHTPTMKGCLLNGFLHWADSADRATGQSPCPCHHLFSSGHPSPSTVKSLTTMFIEWHFTSVQQHFGTFLCISSSNSICRVRLTSWELFFAATLDRSSVLLTVFVGRHSRKELTDLHVLSNSWFLIAASCKMRSLR